jgi:predicted outer membrane protein/sporulation protein YlmC with PRC-barrel domain
MFRNTLLATTAVAALMLAVPATAQQAATQTPQTQAQSQPQLPQADQQFVEKAAIGNQFEIQAAQIALQKSGSDQVKQLAQRIMDDHEKAGDQLEQIVQDLGTQAPTELDQEHQQQIQALQDAPEDQFNEVYVPGQIRAHEETIQLFQKQAEQGQDQQLKQFAQETLPALEDHLEMAQSAAQELNIAAGTTSQQQSSVTQGAATGSQSMAATEAPQVNVEAPPADVKVQQPPAQVTVEQPQAQVTVEQPQPKVTIKQPEPQVTVNQPKPEVTVQQAKPEVKVEQQQPEVKVEQQQPKVEVEQAGKAEVKVEQDQDQARVEQPATAAPPAMVAPTGQDQSAEAQHQERAAAVEAEQETAARNEASTRMDTNAMGIEADQLMGADVYDTQGNEMGEVDNVLVSKDGEVKAVVIAWGGFLGLGERKAAVPMEDVTWDTGQERVVVDMSKDQIKQLPKYDEEQARMQYGDDVAVLR